MKAYFVDEHMLYKGHFKLNISLEVYDIICAEKPINSSFNILAARLFGLDYPTFLQMIRQEYGAELHGKTGKYISYSFTDKPKVNELVKELNKRWNIMYSKRSM